LAGILTVSKDATSVTATTSTMSGDLGQSITISARVTASAPGSGVPTGIVDFFDASTGVDLGRVALFGGSCSLSTPTLSPGSHLITVTYSGDSNFLSSITATSTITVRQSIIVLDPTAGGALAISGNARVTILGGLYVDSSSSSALSASGNSAISATLIDVHGGVAKSGNASLSPAPITKAAVVTDPLKGLSVPSVTGMANFGSYSLSGNAKATISSGVYKTISVSGNANLAMNPGIYIIEGGGFALSGNASLTGTGVTIYNAGSKFPLSGGTNGAISLSGNGTIKLRAAATGAYASLLFIQPASNPAALTFNGNSTEGVYGTIYAPSAQLVEGGNAQLSAALVVDTLTISGNAIANVGNVVATAGIVAFGVNDLTVSNLLKVAFGRVAKPGGLPVGPMAGRYRSRPPGQRFSVQPEAFAGGSLSEFGAGILKARKVTPASISAQRPYGRRQ
jgi:hypothetical protein